MEHLNPEIMRARGAGLSVKQLAFITGYSSASILQWERQERRMPPKLAEQINDAIAKVESGAIILVPADYNKRTSTRRDRLAAAAREVLESDDEDSEEPISAGDDIFDIAAVLKGNVSRLIGGMKRMGVTPTEMATISVKAAQALKSLAEIQGEWDIQKRMFRTPAWKDACAVLRRNLIDVHPDVLQKIFEGFAEIEAKANGERQ